MQKILLYLLAALGIGSASLGAGFAIRQNANISTGSGGAATALTAVATSTLTAAQICGSSFISISPVSTTPTITLPSSSTLFASCLGIVGQTLDVNFRALTTSTILAAGAGGTIINSSALVVGANKGAILRFIHNTNDLSGTYLVYLVNVLN